MSNIHTIIVEYLPIAPKKLPDSVLSSCEPVPSRRVAGPAVQLSHVDDLGVGDRERCQRVGKMSPDKKWSTHGN